MDCHNFFRTLRQPPDFSKWHQQVRAFLTADFRSLQLIRKSKRKLVCNVSHSDNDLH